MQRLAFQRRGHRQSEKEREYIRARARARVTAASTGGNEIFLITYVSSYESKLGLQLLYYRSQRSRREDLDIKT